MPCKRDAIAGAAQLGVPETTDAANHLQKSSHSIAAEPGNLTFGCRLETSQRARILVKDIISGDWSAPQGRPATDWVGLFKVGETDNHNYVSRAYTNGTVTGKAALAGPTDSGQYEVRYLKADSFTDLAVTSNQIELGTVNRQYQMDGQGSIEAMTQKLWGGTTSSRTSTGPTPGARPIGWQQVLGVCSEPRLNCERLDLGDTVEI